MKKLVVLLLLLIAARFCDAQTWDETFNQGNTQRKYLLQQIAALEVYKSYLGKGYKIVRDGLHTINELKSGDLLQHALHFDRLSMVNVAVRQSLDVKVSLQYAVQIQDHLRLIGRLNVSEHFNSAEQKAIHQLVQGLRSNCSDQLSALSDVLHDGRLQLTDDERLERIHAIRAALADMLTVSTRSLQNIKVLAVQKDQTIKEIHSTKRFNGLP